MPYEAIPHKYRNRNYYSDQFRGIINIVWRHHRGDRHISGCGKYRFPTSTAPPENPAASQEAEGQDMSAAGIISYWVGMHANAAKILANCNDNEVFQEMERRTGVHVEFIHPPVGQETEQYNLMVASRDLPDIVSYNFPAEQTRPSRRGFTARCTI